MKRRRGVNRRCHLFHKYTKRRMLIEKLMEELLPIVIEKCEFEYRVISTVVSLFVIFGLQDFRLGKNPLSFDVIFSPKLKITDLHRPSRATRYGKVQISMSRYEYNYSTFQLYQNLIIFKDGKQRQFFQSFYP